MLSWRSAYLVKHRDNFTFTLPISLKQEDSDDENIAHIKETIKVCKVLV
jgi:hypothetical protein